MGTVLPTHYYVNLPVNIIVGQENRPHDPLLDLLKSDKSYSAALSALSAGSASAVLSSNGITAPS